ncbi:hypothetical protein [Pseudonocardia adelaidensis]
MAIASLVIGGAGYYVAETTPPAPTAPTALPAPPALAPMTVEAWAARAKVVLASLDRQLEAVSETETQLQRVPERDRIPHHESRRALQDQKEWLEQQRAALATQLAALRSLPGLTDTLNTEQAQLDALERALLENGTRTNSPDHTAATRRLQEQRDQHRQQRNEAVRALAEARSEADAALRSPPPEAADLTAPIVERIRTEEQLREVVMHLRNAHRDNHSSERDPDG